MYFAGCNSTFYNPTHGELVIRFLEKLDRKVLLAEATCCGASALAGGWIDEAKECAANTVQALAPFLSEDIPILISTPACVLALRNDYRSILGLGGSLVEKLAHRTYELFEYAQTQLLDELLLHTFRSNSQRILYHPSCHLKSLGNGLYAVRTLSLIPSLQIHMLEHGCCGAAASKPIQREGYPIAQYIGHDLFQTARDSGFDLILSDAPACRRWIEDQTQLPVRSSLDMVTRSLGLV